jgi:hypothetical protein
MKNRIETATTTAISPARAEELRSMAARTGRTIADLVDEALGNAASPRNPVCISYRASVMLTELGDIARTGVSDNDGDGRLVDLLLEPYLDGRLSIADIVRESKELSPEAEQGIRSVIAEWNSEIDDDDCLPS